MVQIYPHVDTISNGEITTDSDLIDLIVVDFITERLELQFQPEIYLVMFLHIIIDYGELK